jgi:hypothetical protein
MPNYQNGKIYAIRSYKTDDIYIVSTIMTLSKRMAKHRVMKTFVSSQLILEHGDAYIELIELCPCNSKEELERREGELIRATPNTVNIKIAGRTPQEYRDDNKEIIAVKNKVYAEENKEHIKEYKKEFDELGNNAQPITEGVCCNNCNLSKVIPARLKQVGVKIK